ncbi:unnamed protein product [Rotaria sp. Silwood1]|nr:unnamed protein product [Rotaria sp. Silwood1]CAF3828304.1 unnamed protein product [Rotaria sp. Silwood1]CAF4592402.1 unnamed protein product [Rotaria sp. Silwood1]CAF4593966.1 unnamed protein product [Rotaria sp. Silwood1]CAF5160004.1 unnamed protein product [Rotaria sp. Silwood1]
MSYARRRFLPSRPFRVRIILPPRPYYGGRRVFRPASLASTGASILGGALGVLGGTLGCLLCLSAIAALGLFSCTVAITAYASMYTKFLHL